MARLPDTPCADCGVLLWSSKTSLPAGKRRCQGCRRARSGRRFYDVECAQCGTEVRSIFPRAKFCSRTCSNPFHNDLARFRALDDHRTTRAKRESAAPGLSYRSRRALLAKWIRQGRLCQYCDGAADTIDHVVPLVRGGTNFEGNLVPACRRCNSSKAARVLVEWRMLYVKAA